LVNLSGWPIIGKPHVSNINTNTHDRIEEETNFGPPSGPNNKFTGYNRVQASETN
jgi:hypothetical protein